MSGFFYTKKYTDFYTDSNKKDEIRRNSKIEKRP